MFNKNYFTGIICGIICLFANGLLARDSLRLPTLYPSYLSALDIDDGLPISCAAEGIIDPKGQLWVNPCFSQAEHKAIHFYQFDGNNAKFTNWDNRPAGAAGHQAAISGFNQAGALYGFFRETNHFFFFNPETNQNRFFQLDSANAIILLMEFSPKHGFILYANSKTNHLIYQMRDGKVQLIKKLPKQFQSLMTSNWWHPQIQVLAEDQLYFFDYPNEFKYSSFTNLKSNYGSLFCLDLNTKDIREFTLQDFFGGEPPFPQYFSSINLEKRNIAIDHNGQLLVFLSAWRQAFSLDPLTKEIVKHNDLPHLDRIASKFLEHTLISSDEEGNLLFIFVNQNQAYHAILQDPDGQYYDYSPVLNAAVDASRFKLGFIIDVWSRDFRRQAYVFANGGIIAVDLKLQGSVSTFLENHPTRAITEISRNEYLLIQEGRLPIVTSLNNDTIIPPHTFSIFCEEEEISDLNYYANLKRDRQGGVWFPYQQRLFQYFSDQNCFQYPVGINFNKFELIDSQTVLLAVENDSQLYTYHLPTQELEIFLENGQPLILPGEVNELMLGIDQVVWIASLGGLIKIDLKTGKSQIIGLEDGFQDEKIMCLHQDEQGRIWAGTYAGGLHIFDPVSGAVLITDRKNGLSNNTVVGILPDSEGIRWLATYRGITLVSEQGKVLTQIFDNDGLSTNEFNRYSYYKDSKGRLIFGSVYGVNVIEPEAVKQQLSNRKNLHISLSGAEWYQIDKGAAELQFYTSSDNQTIELPAAHRYLNLKFALSSFIQQEENSFAYRFDKPGRNLNQDEWIFIGNRPELNLYNLPVGRYNILIRGADYRGNWTPEPLVIPIHVKAFFYKQFWFYFLCLLLVGGTIFIWFYRQRIARKKLEEELRQRTAEIMRARDQLISQEKLASLGQLTAGIAHEIKNPLNFITNFSEDSVEAVDEMEELLENSKSQLAPDLYSNYQELVQIFKENAMSIHESGMRLDSIVQSMMDHTHNSNQVVGEIDLNDLITENTNLAYQGFRSVHNTFSAKLDLQLQKDLPIIYGLQQDLGRVLINILNNAFYALQEKKQALGPGFDPQLRIATTLNNSFIKVSIKDNGPGISEQAKEKIFNPFFTTKPVGSGNTGLGLSISHDIIRRHKGRIEVTSKKDTFTEFQISLPLEPEGKKPLSTS